MNMNTEISSIFNQLLKIDTDVRTVFYDVNRKWIKFVLLSIMKREKYTEIREELDKLWTVTGSIREIGGLCRIFKNDKLCFELDQMYCIGEIPIDKAELLVPVDRYQCFYQLKSGAELWECIHYKGVIKDLLCGQSERAAMALNTLSDNKNLYAETICLQKALGEITGGYLNDVIPNFEFSGPSVRTKVDIPSSIEAIHSAYQLVDYIDIPKELLNCFGSLEFDNVISFKLPFWPENTSKWFDRDGFWPEKKIIEKIKQGGCNIVPKEIHYDSNDSNDSKNSHDSHSMKNTWRISFSDAEIALCETLKQFQIKCYIVAKSIYYVHVKDKSFKYENSTKDEPNDLPSYILKTLMFFLLEETSPAAWLEWEKNDDVLKVVSNLFSKLTTHFETRVMPSFFTDEINILRNIPHGFLSNRAIISKKISENPSKFLYFLEANWEEKSKLMNNGIIVGREMSTKMGNLLDNFEIMQLWKFELSK